MRGRLKRARVRLSHLLDRPFASAMAVLFVASAVVALGDLSLTADVLETLVPGWFLDAMSVAYGLSGILLLVGMMFERGDWEAAGCVLALSGLLARAIAIVAVLGVRPETIALILFYVVFGGACIERLRQILNGERIIHTHVQVKLENKEDES